MTTKTILSAIVALLLSVNIYASDPQVLTNEKATEFGKQIERITFVKGSSSEFDNRVVSEINHNGNLQERVFYTWKAFKGWVAVKKLTYVYDASNVLAEVVQVKWDSKKNDWSKDINIAYYATNSDGSLFIAELKKE